MKVGGYKISGRHIENLAQAHHKAYTGPTVARLGDGSMQFFVTILQSIADGGPEKMQLLAAGELDQALDARAQAAVHAMCSALCARAKAVLHVFAVSHVSWMLRLRSFIFNFPGRRDVCSETAESLRQETLLRR